MTSLSPQINTLLAEAEKQALVAKMTSALSRLKGKSRDIVQFLIEDPNRYNLSIEELAQACGTGRATLYRLSQELGYQGFSELRAALLAEPDQYTDHAADNDDDSAIYFGEESIATQQPSLSGREIEEKLLSKLTKQCIAMLLDTYRTLSIADIRRAAQILLSQSPILLYGSALSAGVARMFENRLRALNLTVYSASDTEETIDQLGRGVGVLFCVSYMARTPNIVQILTKANQRGVTTILLTNLQSTPVSRLPEVVLTTGITSYPTTGHDILCRTAELLVIEALYQELIVLQRSPGEHQQPEIGE